MRPPPAVGRSWFMTSDHDGFDTQIMLCEGPVAQYCRALLAVDVKPNPSVDLTVIPHESFVLSLQFALGDEPFARINDRGLLPHVCGLREATHTYRPGGGCRSFFALLTPDGVVALTAGQELPSTPGHPKQPLAHLLSRLRLTALEDMLAREPNRGAQLALFGGWVEDTLATRVHLPWQARRVSRIAASMFDSPPLKIEALASDEGVSRRQLERDFRHWLGSSPKHASQLARVQSVARLGLRGMAMAEIAHRLGFVDQAHMNRTVKKITGVSPVTLARSARNGLSSPFRLATGGGVVYL